MKNNNIVNVYLYNSLVGTLMQQQNNIYFEYDEDFLNSKLEISPVKMPLKRGVFTNHEDRYFNTLMGVFNDSLPDKFGNAVIEQYYKEQGKRVEMITALEKLIYIGNSAMGALEYKPAVENNSFGKMIILSSLVEDARKIIKGNIDTTIPHIMSSGHSAGGAKPKAIIAINSDKNEIVSGSLNNLDSSYKHYIIKFDGVNEYASPQDFNKIEHIYMNISKELNINTAQTSILYDNDLSHLLVERFDRVDGKKIHLHSLSGMMHNDFNKSGTFSYENYLKTIWRVCNNNDSLIDGVKRMIFNVIARNQDDHTKNFSFLMRENGNWELSPSYDLTYSYGNGYTSNHQMSINGKTSDITSKDIHKALDRLGILQQKQIDEIIKETNEIFSTFHTRAKELDIAKDKIERVEKNINYL